MFISTVHQPATTVVSVGYKNNWSENACEQKPKVGVVRRATVLQACEGEPSLRRSMLRVISGPESSFVAAGCNPFVIDAPRERGGEGKKSEPLMALVPLKMKRNYGLRGHVACWVKMKGVGRSIASDARSQFPGQEASR